MPRIDPSQLLRTLSQLLSQEGGIKSAEEVPRIVKLMQKFSKKLVSKCIYIHILRASEMDLLELFLQQKGWDLLNLWFLDSINSGNWHLCGDLVKLFAVCPMNSNRLKENVEVNQAPKLIRQLSIDTRLEADIRNQAQQVLQQWMSVIRAPAQPAPQPQARVVERVVEAVPAPASPTDAGAQPGSDDDWSPSHTKAKRITLGKKTKGSSSPNDSSVDVDDLLADSPSSSDEEDEESSVIRKKKEEIEKRRKEREDKKAKEEEREKKKAQERKDKSRLGYTKTEFGSRGAVDSQEKERIKEVARKLKEESDTKSKTKSSDYEANKGSKMTAGLARIPKIPKKESVEEAKKPQTKSPSLGFGDLLGGLDVQKPKTIIKNKNRDLMEDLMNTSPSKASSNVKKEEKKKNSSESRIKEDRGRKESSEARARDKEDRHKAKEERRSSLTGKEDKERSSREKDKERSNKEDKEKSSKEDKDKERSSKDKSREKERNGHKERSKPSLAIPERKREAGSPVTTPEVNKSPKVIKDSGFLGDVLGDIMKEQPKKRKRRLSEVRAEREAKEAEKEAKEEAERTKRRKEDEEKKSGSGSEEEERTMEVENGGEGEELPFAEPTCELPREVRGILVVARGSKRRGRISWRPEADLVEVNYFEMDDTERANVWKLKSFEEMRKQEAMKEKEVQVAGHQVATEEEEVGSSKEWRVAPIVFADPKTKEQVSRIWECYGRDSQEKEVQKEREGRVLKSLFFAVLPTDPTEPDPQDRGGDRSDTRSIPGEDQSGEGGEGGESLVDHSMRGWPDPKDLAASTPPPAANLPTNLSQLLQDPKMNLLQSILGSGQLSAPPPSLNPEETELFQAQAAAAAALASRGEFNTPPPMAPPPNQHFNQGYDRPPPEGFPLDRPPPGYPGPPRAGLNNFNKRRAQSEGRGGVWGREEGRGGFRPNYRRDGRREERREGREYKRPCKFWMEKGRCHEEDRCKFPHPMANPR